MTQKPPSPRHKAAGKSKSTSPKKNLSLPIIGIGASAGGLEALEGLLSHLPEALLASFVIIQHLDPHHKSMMPELLKKHTALKIRQIEDCQEVEPNCIYLNPPNHFVGLFNGTFILQAQGENVGVRMSIDYFFRSLAEDREETAIAIVLSGTGTDGTLGVKAIKEHGGMSIAQEAAQAAFSGMPASAIGAGLVDMVLPVEEIGHALHQYIHHPYISNGHQSVSEESFENDLKKILFVIRSSTGNDFSGYKKKTIRRRIERRMAMHHIDTIKTYHRYLANTPAESEILFKDLLIGVTRFFRNSEAYAVLQEKALPGLIRSKSEGATIRIWVPGCATGEEAYSLAILFSESIAQLNTAVGVQIFATDIDEDAISVARLGIYPEIIAADVSKQRLRRYFEKTDNAYRINQQIRDMIVFAKQNLISDPPFSKLDLISCRNLLIYIDSKLQKLILPLFHFSLQPNGIMLLGNSETIGGFADLFTPINTTWKIFKRKDIHMDNLTTYPIPPLVRTTGIPAAMETQSAPKTLSSRSIVEKMILTHHAPASVLVNEKYDIIYYSGDTSSYLLQPPGEPSANILKLICKDLRYRLNLALDNAVKKKHESRAEDLKFELKRREKTVCVTIQPVKASMSAAGLMLVVFETKEIPAALEDARGASVPVEDDEVIDTRIKNLEQELIYTRENLHTTIEEMETSGEELKSTNEELQSTNEELQSTNEELETSKEEMQASNEELVTINAELQDKIKDCERSNNDINNLLASTDIATLFLDEGLNIRRFTPATADLFNLIESDVGRPIGDITTRFDYPDFYQDAISVMRDLGMTEKLIGTKAGRKFTVRMLPYRTLENRIDGLVATFWDVTEQEQIHADAQTARRFAESILDTVLEPLVVLDKNFKLISATKSFYHTFKLKPVATEAQSFFSLCDGAWALPELREFLEDNLPQKKTFDNFTLKAEFPGIGTMTLLLNARQVFDTRKAAEAHILLAMRVNVD